MQDFEYARSRMVDTQVERRGVTDPRVLAAMRTVPREKFVEEEFRDFAYEDSPLPIAERQTISQPFIVARMIALAEVRPSDRVLEVGTGSGYGAAVLGHVAAEVFSVERHEALAEVARARLAGIGVRNVAILTGNGAAGWPEKAPFDAIIVTAAASEVPELLKRQLAVGGRLVIPVGPVERPQRLTRITRKGEGAFDEEELEPVRFVPLVAEPAGEAQQP